MRTTTREAVLVDIDGTLCDNRDIIHLLVDPDQRDYDRYHAESMLCPTNPTAVAWVDQHRAAGRSVLIVTARRRRWQGLTEAWLRRHEFTYEAMFMRPDDDERPDDDAKLDMLRLVREKFEPIAAIDDHPGVVALWEREQIPTTVIPGYIG